MSSFEGATAGMPSGGFRILVIDDDEIVRRLIAGRLQRRGYVVETAESGATGIDRARVERFNLVLVDLLMPQMDGIETLARIKKLQPGVAIFMMTAHATVDRAIEAMKQGATEFLMKPVSMDVLSMLIDKIREASTPTESLQAIRARLEASAGGKAIITRSPRMGEVMRLTAKVASLPSTVLIQGESGTGKELVARAVHAAGVRREKRFVALNCSVAPGELLASELFGYEKGAFTGASARRQGYFEAAAGGTIFLDEIGELDVELQAKLLRVIQEKSFQRLGGTEEITTDARVIAATNRDLEEEVACGRFREDLFYRINVVRIVVPPLRERPEDIPLLAYHFLEKYAFEFGSGVEGIAPPVVERLEAHHWPGNVRELENVIEHSVAMGEGGMITLDDLPTALRESRVPQRRSPDGSVVKPFQHAKREFEREYLTNLLERAHGNLALVARMSEIPRQNIYAKLEKHSIDPTDYR